MVSLKKINKMENKILQQKENENCVIYSIANVFNYKQEELNILIEKYGSGGHSSDMLRYIIEQEFPNLTTVNLYNVEDTKQYLKKDIFKALHQEDEHYEYLGFLGISLKHKTLKHMVSFVLDAKSNKIVIYDSLKNVACLYDDIKELLQNVQIIRVDMIANSNNYHKGVPCFKQN